jgi:hypothetical protein
MPEWAELLLKLFVATVLVCALLWLFLGGRRREP